MADPHIRSPMDFWDYLTVILYRCGFILAAIMTLYPTGGHRAKRNIARSGIMRFIVAHLSQTLSLTAANGKLGSITLCAFSGSWNWRSAAAFSPSAD